MLNLQLHKNEYMQCDLLSQELFYSQNETRNEVSSCKCQRTSFFHPERYSLQSELQYLYSIIVYSPKPLARRKIVYFLSIEKICT